MSNHSTSRVDGSTAAPAIVRRLGWVVIAGLSILGFGVGSWLLSLLFVGTGHGIVAVAAWLRVPESAVMPGVIGLMLVSLALLGLTDRTLRRRRVAQDRSA